MKGSQRLFYISGKYQDGHVRAIAPSPGRRGGPETGVQTDLLSMDELVSLDMIYRDK